MLLMIEIPKFCEGQHVAQRWDRPFMSRLFFSNDFSVLPSAMPNETFHCTSINWQGFDVSKLIAEADYDGSGAISLQEFSRHMHQRYSTVS